MYWSSRNGEGSTFFLRAEFVLVITYRVGSTFFLRAEFVLVITYRVGSTFCLRAEFVLTGHHL